MSEKNERAHHVCPWYTAYLFDNPLRRLIHDPAKILGQYVKPGMTVIDVGCGMGFFSLGMARLVGSEGKVISLDIQPQMLRILERRALRMDLSHRIKTRLIPYDGLGLFEPVDFALCFWMVHETPDQALFFSQVMESLVPGARILIAEPGMHVTDEELENSVQLAEAVGFREEDRPRIRLSRSVVLRK